MIRKFLVAVVGLIFAGMVGTAKAAPIVLTNEGLQDLEFILDYYDGGAGSLGSIGPDYDIVFGDSAQALIDLDAGGSGNFANEPSPNTIAFFLSGGDLVMNVLNGFEVGFSFFYSSSEVGSVDVYDGADATGNLLASIPLDVNWQNNNCVGDPNGQFCNWDPIGVAFAGTAFSVSFAGVANQTGFDNITIGSETPGEVPEPSTLSLTLFAVGLFGLGWMLRRRRAS
jgi:hypothetical protein